MTRPSLLIGKAQSLFFKGKKWQDLPSYIPVIFFFLLGFTLGGFFTKILSGRGSASFSQVRQGGYQFINPLLDFETLEETKRGDLKALEGKLESLVESETGNINTSHVSHISVYFKELTTGDWIGINENEEFSPASLLKAPLMVVNFKIAESNPGYLEQKIEYQATTDNAPQNILPKETLEKGKSYSVGELIRRMIVYSDNESQNLLAEHTKKQDLEKIYSDLGMEVPKEEVTENFMTVKEYSGFFRILYNATYLDKEMSEKALELLSKVTYDGGLVAGIPVGTKIAHKFGERAYSLSDIKQLHDCGIIYLPKKPYLLCVMTRGNNFTDLEEVIQEISKMVYQTVSLEN